MRLKHLLLFIAILMLPVSLFADLVYMRDGRILVGKINNQSLTAVSLIDDNGQQLIQKGQIIRIQFGDPNQQKLEIAQRQAREQQIAQQQAESRRLTEERKKAEIEAEQIAQEKRQAEESNKAIEEIQQLTEAAEKAKQEAKKIEQSKLAIDNSTAQLEEQNEIKTRVLSIRTGHYSMQSAVIRNGTQLPFVADTNLILKGGFSFNSVSDAGNVDLPLGSYRELKYETHQHRSKTGWLHLLGYFDANSSPYVIIGQENSIGSVFNGSTNLDYTNHVDSIEIKDKPRLRSGEYNLYFKLYPFSNTLIENLHFLVGGGLLASTMDSKNGIRQTITTGNLDPHSINPMYPALGLNQRQSITEYSEGMGFIHFGVGYLFQFFDIHSVDFLIIASGGMGGGYLNHSEMSLLDLNGIPAKSEAHVRGNSWVNGRRLNIEAGYAITIYSVKVRLFARTQQEHVTISSTKMKTGNGLEKINAMLNQLNGGQPNLTPFIIERMKNPPPYPEASGQLQGIGLEVGFLF